jgi:hypothetical protein
MKTIDKIIPYKINDYQVEYLRNAWIINWIGWNWQNIETILLNVIKWAYGFDNNKSKKLLWDIRILSYYHDIDYFFKMWFYKANFKFSYRLFKLLYWDTIINRIWIFLFAFYVLNKYWKDYYFK